MGILLTFSLGIFIVLGSLIARSARNEHTIEELSISIAFGTMAALSIMELIPEALENVGNDNIIFMLLAIFTGIILLKILDHFIPDHDNVHGFEHDCTPENVIHIGIISSVAVILHNVIEGMAVYSMTAESLKTALFLSLGVGLLNIPMGMVIYSTLKKEKFKIRGTAGGSFSLHSSGRYHNEPAVVGDKRLCHWYSHRAYTGHDNLHHSL
ncbi:MAG: ZIP family metal transporter [Anaerovoracaceae bacterium]